jgi:hypothetical protein
MELSLTSGSCYNGSGDGSTLSLATHFFSTHLHGGLFPPICMGGYSCSTPIGVGSVLIFLLVSMVVHLQGRLHAPSLWAVTHLGPRAAWGLGWWWKQTAIIGKQVGACLLCPIGCIQLYYGSMYPIGAPPERVCGVGSTR